MFDFDGKVALVTGGASGIGEATARAFADAGAKVVILDINQQGAQEVVDQIIASGNAAEAYLADVGDDDQTRTVLDEIIERHGHVDYLVNSAVNFVAAGLGATREQWESAFSVNVIGPALFTAAVAKHMPPGSSIVNLSSISAHAAQPDRWTYNATKAAILALTRAEALDLGSRGIRVNSISPGWIWTAEVQKAAAPQTRADVEPVWGKYHILDRLGEPQEIANAALYLCSDGASFVTGTELFVDGGYNAIGPEGLGDTSSFAGTDLHAEG